MNKPIYNIHYETIPNHGPIRLYRAHYAIQAHMIAFGLGMAETWRAIKALAKLHPYMIRRVQITKFRMPE